MRLRTPLLAVAAACVLAASAAAAGPPPPPPPGVQAAGDACRAKGLTPNTPAFNSCMQQLLPRPQQPGPQQPGPQQPGPLPPSAQACQAQGLKIGSDAFNACVKALDQAAGRKPSAPPTAAQQAAVATCKGKGLVENSPDFQECLKDETSTGPAVRPSDQAAMDGCKASGIKQRTDAFKACVAAASAAASISGWTGEQLAAYNVCKSAGNPFPSNAFAACLSKVLTKLVPTTPKTAQKEVGAVVADCQKQKLLGAAMQKCIRDGLGS